MATIEIENERARLAMALMEAQSLSDCLEEDMAMPLRRGIARAMTDLGEAARHGQVKERHVVALEEAVKAVEKTLDDDDEDFDDDDNKSEWEYVG